MSKGSMKVGFYQLRISLEGPDTEHLCDIWRRIIVPKNLLLHELHPVLQGAMGWEDHHLHFFRINEKEYVSLNEDDLDEYGSNHQLLDERDYVLSDLLDNVETFFYQYDFSDRWDHRIEVEYPPTRIPGNIIDGFPKCVNGQGACPPEDCGGAYGYALLLESLLNPEDTAHADNLRWHGHIDPYAFNVAQANKLVAAILLLYRETENGVDPTAAVSPP